MPFNIEPLDEKEYLIDVDTENLPGKIESKEELKEDKKPDTKKESTKPAETNKENTEENEPESGEDSPFIDFDESDDEGVKEDTKEKPKTKVAEADDKSKEKPKKVDLEEGIDFTAYAQGLIDEGIWYPLQDEEGNVIPSDQLELDKKSFSELAKRQAEWKAEDTLKERENEYGAQYQELVSHIKNKGDIQDLLQNYQEQKDIEEMDATNPEQAEEIIRTYLDSVNWDKADIDDFVDTVKDKGEEHLKSIAEKRKADLVNHVKEEREQIKEAQAAQFTRNKQSQEVFDKKTKEFIYKSDKPERDKKKLEKFLYDYKHPLEGGGKATDMYVKLQEFRSNPELWVKLAEFLENPDNYGEKAKVADKAKFEIFRSFQAGKYNAKGKDSTPERLMKEKEEAPKAPDTFNRTFGKK